jgi:hypothetical protein
MNDRIFVNRNKFDTDEGQYCTVFDSKKDAEDDISRPFDYESIGREYVDADKVKLVIEWCHKNIEDNTDVSGFATQVRDCLEKIQ